jgi:hypothetical protein
MIVVEDEVVAGPAVPGTVPLPPPLRAPRRGRSGARHPSRQEGREVQDDFCRTHSRRGRFHRATCVPRRDGRGHGRRRPRTMVMRVLLELVLAVVTWVSLLVVLVVAIVTVVSLPVLLIYALAAQGRRRRATRGGGLAAGRGGLLGRRGLRWLGVCCSSWAWPWRSSRTITRRGWISA